MPKSKKYTSKNSYKKDTKRIVLLDAHAIIHRAYHALPDSFMGPNGEPTGALYGFIRMILSIEEKIKPDYIIACYDLPQKTFRHEVYSDYKGGRKKTDDALKKQLQRSRDVCASFAIPIYDTPGFEADDMLGTICDQIDGAHDIVIASGDMDTLQLVKGGEVQVLTPKKGIKETIMYDEPAVMGRFGFGPLLLPDYKGLRGDASDNIKGIAGIGEKGATQLITNFGTLENMYEILEKGEAGEQEFLDAGIKARTIKLVKEGKEDALFSKILATIRRDAPIEFVIPEKAWRESISIDTLQEVCKEFGFRSLMTQLTQLFDTEKKDTDSSDTKETSDEGSVPIKQTPEISPRELRDLSVMLWMTNTDLTHPDYEALSLHTKKETADEMREFLTQQINEQELLSVYENIEKPLYPIMEQIQSHGMLCDRSIFQELHDDYTQQVEVLEKNIHQYADEEFNVRSSKQLAEILFTKLELPTKGIKKTGTGRISTKESELEKLRETHAIIPQILQYRELYKILSTYVDALPEHIGADDRIHSELLQHGTATGRFSSQNPNMQNIPVKSDAGRMLRKAFIAPKGFTLLACDYSQIELRVAAILSSDEHLIDIFETGQDVHAAVAARVFGVDAKDVSKNQRRQAKVINFGILYGMGVTALQKNLGSTRAEAQSFLNDYFESFPKIRGYMEDTKAFATKNLFTTTLFGRRRHMPQLITTVPHLRAMYERMAINAPIQGTNADIVKLAMIDVDQMISDKKWKGKVSMIMQIHDEIMFEVADELLDEAREVIVATMENIFEKHKGLIQSENTLVPLKVSSSTGKNWYEMEE